MVSWYLHASHKIRLQEQETAPIAQVRKGRGDGGCLLFSGYVLNNINCVSHLISEKTYRVFQCIKNSKIYGGQCGEAKAYFSPPSMKST